MNREIYVSIVRGPPPSRKCPLDLDQVKSLAGTRADMELRVGETGTQSKKDLVLVDPTGRAPGVLTFIDGRLEIKNPDESTLKWMIDVANGLNARVTDSSLKTYRTPTEKYVHPDDVAARRTLGTRITDARKTRGTRSSTKLMFGLLAVALIALLALKLAGGGWL